MQKRRLRKLLAFRMLSWYTLLIPSLISSLIWKTTHFSKKLLYEFLWLFPFWNDFKISAEKKRILRKGIIWLNFTGFFLWGTNSNSVGKKGNGYKMNELYWVSFFWNRFKLSADFLGYFFLGRWNNSNTLQKKMEGMVI